MTIGLRTRGTYDISMVIAVFFESLAPVLIKIYLEIILFYVFPALKDMKRFLTKFLEKIFLAVTLIL